MALLHSLVPIVLMISIAGIVIAVGLDAELDDLLYLFRRPLMLAKAFLAVDVIVPAAAVLLVFLFPLSPIAKTGVLAMAVSPVPPLVPGKALKVGAERCYAYGLYTALILLAVVTVPIGVAVVGRIFGADVSVPASLIARKVATGVLLPLAVGLAVRRFAPKLAARAQPIVSRLATLLLLIGAVPLFVAAWPAIMGLVGNGTILAMTLTAAIGLAAGHLLGGPNPQDRAALATTSATRHPGLALTIVTANSGDKRVVGAILAMLLVGLLVTLLYQMWIKRRTPAPAVTQGTAQP
jgi:BASS family bile acid:Na+ symporter